MAAETQNQPNEAPATHNTRDRVLGGRLVIDQPANGYRTGIDPIFLAAAIRAHSGDQVLELGCGGGLASLCLAARVDDCHITAIDRDPAAIELAKMNISQNQVGSLIAVNLGDFTDKRIELSDRFDHVFANPPFYKTADIQVLGDGKRASFDEGDTNLQTWVAGMIRAAKQKGWMTLIHQTDRLDDIVAALHPVAGDITILPLWPKTGRAAKRVIVTARRNSKGPTRLLPGLIVHEQDGTYTPVAQSILKEAKAIDLMGRSH